MKDVKKIQTINIYNKDKLAPITFNVVPSFKDCINIGMGLAWGVFFAIGQFLILVQILTFLIKSLP